MKTNNKTTKHRLLTYGMVPEQTMKALIKQGLAKIMGEFKDGKGRIYKAYLVPGLDKVEAYPLEKSRAFSRSMRRRTFMTKFKALDEKARISVRTWNREKEGIDRAGEIGFNKK